MACVANLPKIILAKNLPNNLIYAVLIGMRIEFTSMISDVKSCTDIHQFRNFFLPASSQVKIRQQHLVNK